MTGQEAGLNIILISKVGAYMVCERRVREKSKTNLLLQCFETTSGGRSQHGTCTGKPKGEDQQPHCQPSLKQ